MVKWFEPNPYDTCIVNKMVDRIQTTITWHVGDLKVSHKDPKRINKLVQYLKAISGKITIERGKTHDYLGTSLDYTNSGKVNKKMRECTKEIFKTFPEEMFVLH